MSNFELFEAITVEHKSFHVEDYERFINLQFNLLNLQKEIAPNFKFWLTPDLEMQLDNFLFTYQKEIANYFKQSCNFKFGKLKTFLNRDGFNAKFQIYLD